ncbi:MerR family transcriptional regulator [Dysgonomonas macrotermitis]|uniref:DNA-binding transcriptional regulator, MerR family n=1 Tax=Dysgonomonas macrotermitis TaxID=1346286 RepID=A0A1M5BTY5_9BACT|nr:MerR family transcriptional regulator [Dysgonomonas macrotermitis]SHF45727.1 DNA-binding transcriptional regulator, MerR family [Dysgonomonas macrotermitis]
MIDFENNKKLYYSIKEVAAHFNVNESLLRFWESEFKEIKPRKTSTGIRQYTKEDIDAITLVYSLVKERGLTLEGARQTLKIKKDEETRRLELLNRLEKIKSELNDLKSGFDI